MGTQFAFPDDLDGPTKSLKLVNLARVSTAVLGKLRNPVFSTGRRRFPGSTIVRMPEAPVHEDRELAPRKHDVRSARKVPAMQAKSRARCVKRFSKRHFRPGISLAD